MASRGTYVAVEPFHLGSVRRRASFSFQQSRYKRTPKKRCRAIQDCHDPNRWPSPYLSQLTGKDQSPRHVSTGTGEAVKNPSSPCRNASAYAPRLRETHLVFFRFSAFTTSSLGTLKRAFMPSSKFSVASRPSMYSASLITSIYNPSDSTHYIIRSGCSGLNLSKYILFIIIQ